MSYEKMTKKELIRDLKIRDSQLLLEKEKKVELAARLDASDRERRKSDHLAAQSKKLLALGMFAAAFSIRENVQAIKMHVSEVRSKASIESKLKDDSASTWLALLNRLDDMLMVSNKIEGFESY